VSKIDFRENVVNIPRNSRFFKKPKLWPNKLAFNLMAMAQHHGVPTRLLDWTINAGVAMYFAANGAIGGYSEWTNASKLAVWALDSDRLSLSPHITLFYAPGSVSAHLAAQGGLFSVHPNSGNRAGEFQALSLEDYFVDVPSPLIKLTIPAFEAVRLMHLCNKSGINAARVYPTADGAGKAVIDDFKMGLALEYWNKTEILVRR
ncbi:MAG: FRG domain-containing protein, partial [Hymenobacter sp.]